MADDSFSLFNPSGILTPDQTAAVRSRALMSMGAALMKASGPSPYKNTWFSGLGQGVEGLLNGAQMGTDEMLKQQLVRGQITAQQLGFAQQKAMFDALGLPFPQIPGMPGASAPAAAAAPKDGIPVEGSPGVSGVPWVGGGGAPPAAFRAAAPAAAAPPGLLSPPGQSAPVAPVAPATPAAAPAPATGPMSILRTLPLADRAGIAVGGPKALAKVIGDVTSKNLEKTPGQKDAEASGLANPRALDAAKELDKQDIGQEEKFYSGLQGQGNTAAAMLPNIQLAKSIVNDPKFYSGAGEGANLLYKRALAAISPDHANDPLPQEAFRKIMAANILHQIDDMKAAAQEMGSSGSRIFASQIELMNKAAQNPDNSVSANRFLTELADRAARRNIQLADMASDWKEQHGGRIGPTFEKRLRAWMGENPMFSEEELKNVRSVAAPAQAQPPMDGARQASDGHWYVQQNGKYFRVE